jgi:hypothetical protein
MQRRSDEGYQQFESIPSTHPEGAAAATTQAPAYPHQQPASTAMLATPARQHPFPDLNSGTLAHSATRPTLPPLAQFQLRPEAQFGSSYDATSASQQHAAHVTPAQDYHALSGYQSLPSASIPRGRPSPLSAQYGQPGAAPFDNPRPSPGVHESLQNPLKRPYQSFQEG